MPFENQFDKAYAAGTARRESLKAAMQEMLFRRQVEQPELDRRHQETMAREGETTRHNQAEEGVQQQTRDTANAQFEFSKNQTAQENDQKLLEAFGKGTVRKSLGGTDDAGLPQWKTSTGDTYVPLTIQEREKLQREESVKAIQETAKVVFPNDPLRQKQYIEKHTLDTIMSKEPGSIDDIRTHALNEAMKNKTPAEVLAMLPEIESGLAKAKNPLFEAQRAHLGASTMKLMSEVGKDKKNDADEQAGDLIFSQAYNKAITKHGNAQKPVVLTDTAAQIDAAYRGGGLTPGAYTHATERLQKSKQSNAKPDIFQQFLTNPPPAVTMPTPDPTQ